MGIIANGRLLEGSELPRSSVHGCSAEPPYTDVPRNIRAWKFRGTSVHGTPRNFRPRMFRGNSVHGNSAEHPIRNSPDVLLVFHGNPKEFRGSSVHGSSAEHPIRNFPDVLLVFHGNPKEFRGSSVHGCSAEHPCTELRVSRFFDPIRNFHGVPYWMFRGTSVHGTPWKFRIGSKMRETRSSVKSSAAETDVPRRKSVGVPTDDPLPGG